MSESDPKERTPNVCNKPSSGKRSSMVKDVWNYFCEFSTNTTVHGFKYLVENGRCVVEKLWWITVLSLCIYTCGSMVALTLKKWETNPVFISFSQTPMRIWNIPFPAITVCPGNKVRKSKYDYSQYSYLRRKNLITDADLKRFLDINKFCNIKADTYINITSHSMDVDSVNSFVEVAPRDQDLITMCYLKGQECFDYFSAVLTQHGLCYTFNQIARGELYNNITYLPKDVASRPRNSSHWSVDENYNKTREEVFPVRATSTADSLFFTLHAAPTDFNPACAQQRDFKIFFHHPAEVPTSSTDYIRLARDEAYNIKLIPDVTVTASTLINYEPHKRGCFFSHEKKLKFYKIYTERNCKVECLANYTLQHCKCVSYYLPNDGKTTICGLLDHACEDTAEADLLHLDMESEISATDGTKSELPFCDCLPLCTSIVYNADITQSHNYDINVDVAFKDTKFTIRERNELFSNTDFWASCGGLFGLFTGFSVISLAEIIYYLSLRWVCNICTFRKRFWFL